MNEILELEDGEQFSYDTYPRQTILEAEIALLKQNKSIYIGVLGMSFIGEASDNYVKRQLPDVEAALVQHIKELKG